MQTDVEGLSMIKLKRKGKEHDQLDLYPGTAYEGDKSFIFVGYSDNSREIAYSFIEKLICYRYRVWYSRAEATDPTQYEQYEEHLHDCTIYMPLITSDFFESWRRIEELRSAKEYYQKDIFPIYLDSVEPPRSIDSLFSDCQSFYWDDFEEELLFFQGLFNNEKLDETRIGGFSEIYNTTYDALLTLCLRNSYPNASDQELERQREFFWTNYLICSAGKEWSTVENDYVKMTQHFKEMYDNTISLKYLQEKYSIQHPPRIR